MVNNRRLAAWAVMGIGLALVVGVPSVLGDGASTELLLGVSVVGGTVAFAGALWDDTICRSERDERMAEIHYRSGYNALLALAALLGTVFFTAVNLDIAVDSMVLWAALMAGLAVYFGSVAWFKRTM